MTFGYNSMDYKFTLLRVLHPCASFWLFLAIATLVVFATIWALGAPKSCLGHLLGIALCLKLSIDDVDASKHHIDAIYGSWLSRNRNFLATGIWKLLCHLIVLFLLKTTTIFLFLNPAEYPPLIIR